MSETPELWTLPEDTLIRIEGVPFRTVGKVVVRGGCDVHKLLEGGPLYAFGITDHPAIDHRYTGSSYTGSKCSEPSQSGTE